MEENDIIVIHGGNEGGSNGAFPLVYNNTSETLKVVIELVKTPVTDADVSAAKSNITITVNAQPGIWH